MIVDEKSRNELYAGLQEVLGPERAAILMAYLSPFPWSDLATKPDIREMFDQQTQLLRAEIRDQGVSFTLAMADQRDVLRKEMIQQTWVIVFALVATMASLAGVFIAAG